MSTLTLQKLLNDHQKFDAYLTQFGEDPNKFPGPMNKFIKLIKIAQSKDMIKGIEDTLINSPHFDEYARKANNLYDIAIGCFHDSSIELATANRKCEFIQEVINHKDKEIEDLNNHIKLLNQGIERDRENNAHPIVAHAVVAHAVVNDPVAEINNALFDLQNRLQTTTDCNARVTAERHENMRDMADMVEGLYKEMITAIEENIIPKFSNISTSLESQRGREVILIANDVEQLFQLATDGLDTSRTMIQELSRLDPMVRALRREISPDQFDGIIQMFPDHPSHQENQVDQEQ